MSDLLFWVLCGILFVVAVAIIVFGLLVGRHQNSYLFWVAAGVWGMLCLALALALKARFL
jgi:uncharacterized membrane protein